MSTPIPGRGAWLTLLARQLVVDVRQDDGRHHRDHQALTHLAGHAPGIVVDLLVEVARHVDDAVVARIVADGPSHATLPDLLAREAHRLHQRGEDAPWVAWGERAYQVLRSRRRRRGTA